MWTNLVSKIKKKPFPPVPTWRPDTPVDIENILSTAKHYTGSKLQLAVFKYGTVALMATHIENIESEAKLALHKIYYAHPDFKPVTMDDGNYLIEYTQPAFNVVFKEELEEYWPYINAHHMKGVCNDEILIDGGGRKNVFTDLGKICLYGRAKMFMDAQDPQVVKTFDPVR
jgi:hypothetical protein